MHGFSKRTPIHGGKRKDEGGMVDYCDPPQKWEASDHHCRCCYQMEGGFECQQDLSAHQRHLRRSLRQQLGQEHAGRRWVMVDQNDQTTPNRSTPVSQYPY